MKKIIISQRVDKIGKHNELRNNLDFRFIKMIENLGFLPIILPNNLSKVSQSIKEIKPNAIILSSGGDPRKNDERFTTETSLIKYAIKKKIPLLGICRGAQFINIFFNGNIIKIKNHVRKINKISGPITKYKTVKVNSYHDYGIFIDLLGSKLEPLAFAGDKSIECFKHNKYKIMGIMWHPERYNKLRKFETEILKNFLRWN